MLYGLEIISVFLAILALAAYKILHSVSLRIAKVRLIKHCYGGTMTGSSESLARKADRIIFEVELDVMTVVVPDFIDDKKRLDRRIIPHDGDFGVRPDAAEFIQATTP